MCKKPISVNPFCVFLPFNASFEGDQVATLVLNCNTAESYPTLIHFQREEGWGGGYYFFIDRILFINIDDI